MLNILRTCIICKAIYHSDQKECKLKNAICLYVICIIKKEHVVHIRAQKQTLNHGLILKKVHRVIQFNQGAWLKPYTEKNKKKLN